MLVQKLLLGVEFCTAELSYTVPQIRANSLRVHVANADADLRALALRMMSMQTPSGRQGIRMPPGRREPSAGIRAMGQSIVRFETALPQGQRKI